jgi:hypothetical protein
MAAVLLPAGGRTTGELAKLTARSMGLIQSEISVCLFLSDASDYPLPGSQKQIRVPKTSAFELLGQQRRLRNRQRSGSNCE